jgi:CubicO group peptidase (beta-lactamase class C family)
MKYFLLPAFLVVLYGNGFSQTGIPVPTMTATDNLITTFLNNNSIPGATVAIAKDGKIVYNRAFGYADVAKTIPTQPYSLFRIASLSKQLTAVAIMKLVENGQLSLSAKVFGPGSILADHPVFSTTTIADTRIYNITVQHLLEHAGGWNRDIDCNASPTAPYPYFQPGCDPISFPLTVTQQTGTSNPVTKDALIKFVLQKGLNFAPGTSYNYSNIGYLILGEVIEKISGQPYESFVKDQILAPLGIYDMHIAKNLRSEKQEREGEYTGNGYNTYSLYGDNTIVPWEYGGFSVSAMDAHGGWIASARDMLKFLTAVDGFATKPDILQPATIASMVTPSANNTGYAKGWAVNGSNNWWHTGSLDGTASEWVRANNGYTWIIILNKRQNTNAFWTALDNLGWSCIAATTTWPTYDLMASPTTNASGLSFSNTTNTSLTVNWTNGNGDRRLLLAQAGVPVAAYPQDGSSYTVNPVFGNSPLSGSATQVVYDGTGNSATVTGLTPNTTYYFRVVEYNQNAGTGNNALFLLGNNPIASKVAALSLPVNFLYFKASPQDGNSVQLDWATAQESNNDRFEVERSADGVNYTRIATIAGHNNSSVPLYYGYTDKQALPALNFYRLKQIDKDGDFKYSSIVSVRFDAAREITISPNPARSYIEVRGANVQQAFVMDLTGKTLITKKPAANTDNRINIASLPKGIYVVKVILKDSHVITKRLIVQ